MLGKLQKLEEEGNINYKQIAEYAKLIATSKCDGWVQTQVNAIAGVIIMLFIVIGILGQISPIMMQMINSTSPLYGAATMLTSLTGSTFNLLVIIPMVLGAGILLQSLGFFGGGRQQGGGM
ncbi:hypothetical protein [Methanococcus voltae]|uniref:Uncharacterized protein n=1 Tax=Methanococcus voltae (strain ATCC BAA-1334 / A3) TaxID=456320 RepID=D7DSP7_METV3|nr:hypothetical protein [Methanococcus voltae]MCS3901757.1 trimethylamine:corrinoid methyltransferase-like protein [Methanococcus voltae]